MCLVLVASFPKVRVYLLGVCLHRAGCGWGDLKANRILCLPLEETHANKQSFFNTRGIAIRHGMKCVVRNRRIIVILPRH